LIDEDMKYNSFFIELPIDISKENNLPIKSDVEQKTEIFGSI